MTCFGYYRNETAITWNDLGALYGTWDNWNVPWNSGAQQTAYPTVVAGNQEGWTFTIQPDKSANSQSLQITDITLPSTLTVIDHNLAAGDYLRVEEAQGSTNLNNTIVEVLTITDANTIVVDGVFTGTYLGGGKLKRVSKLRIRTKPFNPGTPLGRQFTTAYADILLTTTDDGEVSLDTFLDTNPNSSTSQLPVGNAAILGSNVLFTKPETGALGQVLQNAIWHRYFIAVDAQMLQLEFTLSDTQLRDYAIATSLFEMQAMLIYVEAGGRLIS